MILTRLADNTANGLRRISMDLVWENNDRPRQTLYFEAGGKTAEILHANANAFAIACLPLAAWLNEERLLVEDKLCKRLRYGLSSINQVFKQWFPRCSLVDVQASEGFQTTRPPDQRRVATLLSGGVDGLATLRINRLDYPLDHPESIKACITLFGINKFDIDEQGNQVPERLDAFEAVVGRLSELADAENYELHPVRTNIRSLAPGYSFWVKMGFGAGHSAVSQLFLGTYDKVLLASDGDGPNPPPVAIHPVFNQHFSTDAVRIQSEQDEMTRLQKIDLLTDWEYGRRFMQPCHYVHIPEGGAINCGECEKCVRTMLSLIGLGKLDEVSAFEQKDLKPIRVFLIPVSHAGKAKLLGQAIGPLQKAGRSDLVWAIRARLALYYLLRH